jgi:hypothetical protein
MFVAACLLGAVVLVPAATAGTATGWTSAKALNVMLGSTWAFSHKYDDGGCDGRGPHTGIGARAKYRVFDCSAQNDSAFARAVASGGSYCAPYFTMTVTGPSTFRLSNLMCG